MTRALMLQGTGSDVGKTLLVAGLCRLFRRRGMSVRPFKPQNMSNHAAIAAGCNGEAGEIGRAQWLQALACGAPPSVHMNPVLLKPQSDLGAQIVVHGKVASISHARRFGEGQAQLLQAIATSWDVLRGEADLVLVEGAGSPAEINLRDRDIANMGFATRAGVPVVLVGDIDRGGVIAALAGTHLVLPPWDRQMVAGYIVNKFRGDVALFDGGIAAIGDLTGWPSFGVVPWFDEAVHLPAEDAVVLSHPRGAGGAGLTIAVPMLPRIANFDDLDPLRGEPEVDVVFVPPGTALPRHADIIVLPGSKATIADLAFLREQGWAGEIAAHHARGGTVIGLCGGYQMLGHAVEDPDVLEGGATSAPGLGLIDVSTRLTRAKTLRTVSGRSLRHGCPVSGYEIHLGETDGPARARGVFDISGRAEGAASADGRVWGSYLHGVFSSDAFRAAFLAEHGVRASGQSYLGRIEATLDRLADHLETHLDADALLAAALPARALDHD